MDQQQYYHQYQPQQQQQYHYSGGRGRGRGGRGRGRGGRGGRGGSRGRGGRGGRGGNRRTNHNNINSKSYFPSLPAYYTQNNERILTTLRPNDFWPQWLTSPCFKNLPTYYDELPETDERRIRDEQLQLKQHKLAEKRRHAREVRLWRRKYQQQQEESQHEENDNQAYNDDDQYQDQDHDDEDDDEQHQHDDEHDEDHHYYDDDDDDEEQHQHDDHEHDEEMDEEDDDYHDQNEQEDDNNEENNNNDQTSTSVAAGAVATAPPPPPPSFEERPFRPRRHRIPFRPDVSHFFVIGRDSPQELVEDIVNNRSRSLVIDDSKAQKYNSPQMKDNDAVVVAAALRNNTSFLVVTLKAVRLSYCGINPILYELGRHPTVRVLDMRNTILQQESFTTLVDAVRENRNIIAVELNGCGVPEDVEAKIHSICKLHLMSHKDVLLNEEAIRDDDDEEENEKFKDEYIYDEKNPSRAPARLIKRIKQTKEEKILRVIIDHIDREDSQRRYYLQQQQQSQNDHQKNKLSTSTVIENAMKIIEEKKKNDSSVTCYHSLLQDVEKEKLQSRLLKEKVQAVLKENKRIEELELKRQKELEEEARQQRKREKKKKITNNDHSQTSGGNESTLPKIITGLSAAALVGSGVLFFLKQQQQN